MTWALAPIENFPVRDLHDPDVPAEPPRDPCHLVSSTSVKQISIKLAPSYGCFDRYPPGAVVP